MKEKDTNTDQTASVCSAKKTEAEILREITFFISRFFTVEIEDPTEEDVRAATRLAELVLTLMAQMLNRGIREKQEPFFNVMLYVKDMGGGVGRVNYAFETQGGKMFEQLGLGVMSPLLEKAIGDWCTEVWGGKLTTKAAETFEQWGHNVPNLRLKK